METSKSTMTDKEIKQLREYIINVLNDTVCCKPIEGPDLDKHTDHTDVGKLTFINRGEQLIVCKECFKLWVDVMEKKEKYLTFTLTHLSDHTIVCRTSAGSRSIWQRIFRE